LAERFLLRQGLKLMHRNYRCRWGEVDRVMEDSGTLVFVEVRLRTRQDFASPEGSVDARKQDKLIRTARYFIARHPHLSNMPARFDVVALTDVGESSIRWFRNAFDTTGW
jgi:putative endonuclease